MQQRAGEKRHTRGVPLAGKSGVTRVRLFLRKIPRLFHRAPKPALHNAGVYLELPLIGQKRNDRLAIRSFLEPFPVRPTEGEVFLKISIGFITGYEASERTAQESGGERGSGKLPLGAQQLL